MRPTSGGGLIGKVPGRVKAELRERFGIWPLFEARNRVTMARETRRVRLREDAEVAHLLATCGSLGRATVVTVVPTYRRPDLLVRAVRSALDQDHDDHAVVVVDDGGGLARLPSDPRLTAVSLRQNIAVVGAVRNVGLRLTDSRYVAFLDDDNEWRPNHLSTALARLEAGADLVYTSLERHLADGTPVDVLGRDYDRHLLADGDDVVDINAVVVRRARDVLFSRIPRVKATLPAEDWEFVYRLSRTRRVDHVPVPTVRYLVNESSYYSSWDMRRG
jgi:hypothetical protein